MRRGVYLQVDRKLEKRTKRNTQILKYYRRLTANF